MKLKMFGDYPAQLEVIFHSNLGGDPIRDVLLNKVTELKATEILLESFHQRPMVRKFRHGCPVFRVNEGRWYYSGQSAIVMTTQSPIGLKLMGSADPFEQPINSPERDFEKSRPEANSNRPPLDWLEQFFGAFADATEFEVVIDCGRANREAERRAAVAGMGIDE